MRISDWSSDVCSSDLIAIDENTVFAAVLAEYPKRHDSRRIAGHPARDIARGHGLHDRGAGGQCQGRLPGKIGRRIDNPHMNRSRGAFTGHSGPGPARSEEHTSELQSLMRISYAVFCLKKKQ